MCAYRLRLKKENFKFACSHFAIFGPACGELMHGHNYYVTVELIANELDKKLGLAVEFNQIKPLIAAACQEWDECVLFPKLSPYLKIKSHGSSHTIEFNKKIYSFPKDDVRFIDALNVSVEELSKLLWEKISAKLKKFKRIKQILITVEETKGQSCTYTE